MDGEGDLQIGESGSCVNVITTFDSISLEERTERVVEGIPADLPSALVCKETIPLHSAMVYVPETLPRLKVLARLMRCVNVTGQHMNNIQNIVKSRNAKR